MTSLVAFATLAEPTRQRILDELRIVGQCKEAGLRVVAGGPLFNSEHEQFEAVDQWLEPYRRLWTRHLDALERHLDSLPAESEHPDKEEQ